MKTFGTDGFPLAVWLMVVVCVSNFACYSSSADEEKLLETDVAFSQASATNGPAEAFNMFLDDNAIQLPANSHPIIGREAIFEGMKEDEGVALTWTPVKAEVSKSGDLGYTWGNYKVSRRGTDGIAKFGYGKYLNVWKKQPNGEWKVLIDMGNSSPPPENRPPE